MKSTASDAADSVRSTASDATDTVLSAAKSVVPAGDPAAPADRALHAPVVSLNGGPQPRPAAGVVAYATTLAAHRPEYAAAGSVAAAMGVVWLVDRLRR